MQNLIRVFDSSSNEENVVEVVDMDTILNWMKGNESYGLKLKERFIEQRKDIILNNTTRYLKNSKSNYAASFNFQQKMKYSDNRLSTGFLCIVNKFDSKFYNSDLIFASGLLNNRKGRFYIIRTFGITLNNVEYNLELLSRKLPFNIDIDNFLRNINVQELHFDPNLYENKNSSVFEAHSKDEFFDDLGNLNIDSLTILKIRLRNKIRFDNLEDKEEEFSYYNELYMTSDEPVYYLKINSPHEFYLQDDITQLYFIAIQIRLLNPLINTSELFIVLIEFAEEYDILDSEYYYKLYNVAEASGEYNDDVYEIYLDNASTQFYFNYNYSFTEEEKEELKLEYSIAEERYKLTKD